MPRPQADTGTPLPARLPEVMCAVISDATRTRHRPPESVTYIRVTLGGVHSMGLDECPMTCIYHYSPLCPTCLSPSPSPLQPLTLLLSP